MQHVPCTRSFTLSGQQLKLYVHLCTQQTSHILYTFWDYIWPYWSPQIHAVHCHPICQPLVVCLSITPIRHHCMLWLHYIIAWQITILLSLREPFFSNISAPTVVSAWHFPSPAKCPFIINADLTFLQAILPPSLSQYFFPTFPLHLVRSLLNVIMFIYSQPLLHYCLTIFQCSDSGFLLPEWSALYEEHPDLVATVHI